MAHVQKRTYVSKKTGKRSTSWQARYFAPDGRQHARRFARRVDAEAWLCDNGAAISKGAWIDPSAGKVTFEVYAETWRTSQVHRPTTAEQVRINMTRHIVPAFKGRPIASIRATEVQSWVKRLSEQLAPGTVEVVYRYFASICRSAVNDRIIAFNPCEGVKLPKKEQRRVVPLETAEVVALIDAMPERYRAAAVVAAGAGLRQGEVFGLTVDRVDFPRRTLTVDRQLVTVSQSLPYLALRKLRLERGPSRSRRRSSLPSRSTSPPTRLRLTGSCSQWGTGLQSPVTGLARSSCEPGNRPQSDRTPPGTT